VSDQINLRKKLPSKATPWIEWHGWTNDTCLEWLQQLWRSGSQVHIGDIKEGSRSYPTAEAAVAALQRAVAKKLKEGFEYEGEPPPPPPPKPSKPWPKGRAKAPRWLAKVDRKELAHVCDAIASGSSSVTSRRCASTSRPAGSQPPTSAA